MKTKICLIMVLLLVFSVSLSWAALSEKIKVDPFPELKTTPLIRGHNTKIPEGVEIKEVEKIKSSAVPLQEIRKEAPKGNRMPGDLLWDDNFEAGAFEDDLYYYVSFSSLFPCPDAYGDCEYGTRYTALHDGGNLDGAYFYWYNAVGTPSATVHVYDVDVNNLPGNELGSVVVNYADIVLNAWNYVDLSGLGLSYDAGEDFFITYSVIDGVYNVNHLSIVVDDGSSGANRSVELYIDTWEYVIDGWGTDYEFWMDAILSGLDPSYEPWTPVGISGPGWQWVEPSKGAPTSAHSPTHAWWVDDDTLNAPRQTLLSPEILIPSTHPKCFLQLWYWCDLIDITGSPSDNWEIAICQDTCGWHTSTYEAWVGNSWWCGSEVEELYGDLSIYYLTSPNIVLNASGSSDLSFKLKYEIEDPAACTIPGCDGWDVCNVQISTDNWVTYDFLIPDTLTTTTPDYNVTSSYAGLCDLNVYNYPGWAGLSGGWVDASFDLTGYAGSTVQIRYALASDEASAAKGMFVDDVVVTSNSVVVFEDDADVNVNLIPAQALPMLVELTHDNWTTLDTTWIFMDDNTIWIGSLDLTPYQGEYLKIAVSSMVDFDYGDGPGGNPDTLNGEGLWIDDVQIIGLNIPEIDAYCDFTIVPYPSTIGLGIKSEFTPKIIWHQAGYGGTAAYCYLDVVDVGNIPPVPDYRALPGPILELDEYALIDLTRLYTPIAGTYNYAGWVVATGDTSHVNDYAPEVPVTIYDAGKYELGYNSRLVGGVYYPGIPNALTYYTPFSDGILSGSKDEQLNGVRWLAYSRGGTPGVDTASLTISVYNANPDTTLGSLLYTEELTFYSTRFEWMNLPFSTPVTISQDFFILVTGEWPSTGTSPDHLVYFMLCDNNTEPLLGESYYAGHSFYYDDSKGIIEELTNDLYWNAMINIEIPPEEPQNVVITIDVSKGNDVILTWDSVQFATDYKVYRSTDAYTGFTELVGTTGGATTYTDVGGAAGTKFFYKVTGF